MIRVAIVDDHHAVRLGLHTALRERTARMLNDLRAPVRRPSPQGFL